MWRVSRIALTMKMIFIFRKRSNHCLIKDPKNNRGGNKNISMMVVGSRRTRWKEITPDKSLKNLSRSTLNRTEM